MHRPASCTALNTKLEQWRQPCGDVEEGHLAPPEAGQPCIRRIVPEDVPHQQPAVDASQTAGSSRAAVSGRQGHAPGSAGRDAGWRRGCCSRRIPSTGGDRLLCHLRGVQRGGLEPPQCPSSPLERIRSSHEQSPDQPECCSELLQQAVVCLPGPPEPGCHQGLAGMLLNVLKGLQWLQAAVSRFSCVLAWRLMQTVSSLLLAGCPPKVCHFSIGCLGLGCLY